MSEPPLAAVSGLAALGDAMLAEWRAGLEAAAYRPDVIGECESLIPFPVEAMRRDLILWMLERRSDPAALLARLWSYDDAVDAAALEPVAGPRVCAALLQAGVLVREGARVRAMFRLMPFEDLWVLSDRPQSGTDAVMGPGGTTGEAVRLLPARIAGDVLDLGCGAGSLALVAARRGARRVTGTDVNPRAAEVAALNARLNGIEAEFLAGDLFAPVAGRRFDRILCQPPYVVCPPGTAPVTYLHGGARGETISSRVLREAPAHLAPGGCALVLLDVPLGDGVPLERRFRERVGDPGVDLCAIVATSFPPVVQSAIYAMLEDPSLGEAYGAAARRYREHFESSGVREFRHVALVMRRPAAPAALGITAVLPVHMLPRPAGRSVDDVMAALSLAAAAPDALATAPVAPSPWARFVQERERPVLDEEPDYKVRMQSGGIAADQELSAASLLLLEKLGAAASVEEGAAAYAAAIGEPAGTLRGAVIEFVRRGLGTGLIVPRGERAG